MAKPLSFGKFEVNLTAGGTAAGGEIDEQSPFKIAILGDFSGRASRGLFDSKSLASRKPILIDRDNFDEVMARLAPELHLNLVAGQEHRVAIPFRELDDFHPDKLVPKLELFGVLREVRKRLSNAKTFAAAAEEVRSWLGVKRPEPEKGPTAPAAAPSEPASENLLEQILGDSKNWAASAESPEARQWKAYIQQLAAPYALPKEDPQQAELIAVVDELAGEQLRTVLHHRDFQALEAAWRGAFFLVRRLETDATLKLYLLDVARSELAADLASVEDLQESAIYRLLVEPTVNTPGGQPWAVLIGNYTFDASQEDVELLGRMGKIARAAGAPFFAGASPRVLGCHSLANSAEPRDWPALDTDDVERWAALRTLPEASSLGLALPRFLLRQPYGKGADRVEQLAFEELPGTPKHESYLWGNPAFVCACLLGQAFTRYGWSFRPGVVQEVDGLPLHTYRDAEGESALKPCAEVVLNDRAAAAVADKGIMPLRSVQGSDAVRLGGFFSVAEPTKALAGPWR